MLHINLSCYALQSICNRGWAFGDLDALQPLARNIGEPERCCQSAHYRAVLIKHLGICAAKAKQFYLLCSRYCIGVANAYACRVFKALRKAAAGHFAESRSSNHLCLYHCALCKVVGISSCCNDSGGKGVVLIKELHLKHLFTVYHNGISGKTYE